MVSSGICFHDLHNMLYLLQVTEKPVDNGLNNRTYSHITSPDWTGFRPCVSLHLSWLLSWSQDWCFGSKNHMKKENPVEEEEGLFLWVSVLFSLSVNKSPPEALQLLSPPVSSANLGHMPCVGLSIVNLASPWPLLRSPLLWRAEATVARVPFVVWVPG